MAVLFTGVWYYAEAGIHFGRGRIAWGAGLFIAFAVLMAGTALGQRRVSFALPIISFLLTLAAVVVGEYLIISEQIAEAAGPARWDVIQLATINQVRAVAADYLTLDPFRPVLWFLAIAAAWLLPWGVLVGSGSEEKA